MVVHVLAVAAAVPVVVHVLVVADKEVPKKTVRIDLLDHPETAPLMISATVAIAMASATTTSASSRVPRTMNVRGGEVAEVSATPTTAGA